MHRTSVPMNLRCDSFLSFIIKGLMKYSRLQIIRLVILTYKRDITIWYKMALRFHIHKYVNIMRDLRTSRRWLKLLLLVCRSCYLTDRYRGFGGRSCLIPQYPPKRWNLPMELYSATSQKKEMISIHWLPPPPPKKKKKFLSFFKKNLKK
jgi:hypothetical protein